MGIILLALAGLYLVFSLGVVIGAMAYARREGRSTKRWGWSAALMMYLIPFWDWIPTMVVHQYYCATEAGFWVYKTPEQWIKENPGVMETLVSYNRSPGGFSPDWPSRHELRNDGHEKTNVNAINQRLNVLVSWQDTTIILPIVRAENTLVDVKKNEVIARYIDFGSGNSVKNTVGAPGPMKFWLHRSDCIGGSERHIEFGKFYLQFRGTEK